MIPDLMPNRVHKIEALGIPEGIVEALILKFLKREFSLDNRELARLLRVSLNIISPITAVLSKKKFLDSPAPPKYVLTSAGKEMARSLEEDDAYVGPCPVSFQDYCEVVTKQAERERRVTLEDVECAFEGLEVDPFVLKTIKEGFNSQAPMLFYGPPGNGKSQLTHGIHNLLKDPVLVPYAFVFSGKCVRVFDVAYHKYFEPAYSDEKALISRDERWAICHAPLVVVGTEFRVEHFNISFDGTYDAPPQLKANNGIFVLDDLGRQAQDHNMILNQFIYPLENKQSIIKMAGGANMRVPYRQRLLLSTNLDKDHLIDDAFQRRLLYQIKIEPPSEKAFVQIFINEGKKRGLQDEQLLQSRGEKLLSWYKEDGFQLRACDPRNLFTMLDAMVDAGGDLQSVFSDENLREVYLRYPKAEQEKALRLQKP